MGLNKANSTSFKKGIVPWIKGRTHSEETRKKLRLSRLGRKLSPESIKKRTETRRRLYLEGKLVNGMKGKHQSLEAKIKIGDASRNRLISDFTREKMSKIRIGTHPSKETLKRLSESHKGHIHSEEHKAKIRASAHKGKDSHMWKGGISSLATWIRKSLLYKQWVCKCMGRDKWTCVTCHKKGGDMHVHHIKLFADILEDNNIKTREQAILCKELWDTNNGITICEECHRFTHKYLKSIEKQDKESYNINNQPLFNFTINNLKGGLRN